MLKKIVRGIFSAIGLIVGYVIAELLLSIPQIESLNYFNTAFSRVIFIIILAIIFALILYIISPAIYKAISNIVDYIEKSMQKMSITEIILVQIYYAFHL